MWLARATSCDRAWHLGSLRVAGQGGPTLAQWCATGVELSETGLTLAHPMEPWSRGASKIQSPRTWDQRWDQQRERSRLTILLARPCVPVGLARFISKEISFSQSLTFPTPNASHATRSSSGCFFSPEPAPEGVRPLGNGQSVVRKQASMFRAAHPNSLAGSVPCGFCALFLGVILCITADNHASAGRRKEEPNLLQCRNVEKR